MKIAVAAGAAWLLAIGLGATSAARPPEKPGMEAPTTQEHFAPFVFHMPNQHYSIVIHRDTQSNQIPHAFIYSRSGQVPTPRFVQDLPGAARTYIQLETAAGTSARLVGQY